MHTDVVSKCTQSLLSCLFVVGSFKGASVYTNSNSWRGLFIIL